MNSREEIRKLPKKHTGTALLYKNIKSQTKGTNTSPQARQYKPKI